MESVVVFNRTEGDLGQRLAGFTLKLLDSERQEVFVARELPAPSPRHEVPLSGGDPQQLVRRAAIAALPYIRGQEEETFATLAKLIQDDLEALAAVRAVARLPKSTWNAEAGQPLLNTLLTRIRQIPPAERTTPGALDMLDLANGLASLLPADEARAVRAELGELGVRILRLGTLPERMAYDQDVLVMAAGKPVEILFENIDLMPHNLVIAQPGAMAEIGLAAEATATQPDAAARQYVPPSDKILLSSRLLKHRELQKLSFTAPTHPGVYPYVCTFPGHWRRMYGALYVVDNLDEYLADPDAYLVSHPLPIQDELLADRRPRTEWKLDDLAASVEGLTGGRSFGSGKQMFQVANCIACHKLGELGNAFGPELAKLDAKFQPMDILKEILDPSAKINEKFFTYTFELDSGNILTGLIVEETPEVIKVIENPLASAQPTEIKPGDVVTREQAKISLMPKGLADKLSREEILDLISFVMARGDKNHALFQGEAHDHGSHEQEGDGKHKH